MSIDTIRVDIKWDETERMFTATLLEKTFKSRYELWAKAHALQWYVDELYRIKKLTTVLD